MPRTRDLEDINYMFQDGTYEGPLVNLMDPGGDGNDYGEDPSDFLYADDSDNLDTGLDINMNPPGHSDPLDLDMEVSLYGDGDGEEDIDLSSVHDTNDADDENELLVFELDKIPGALDKSVEEEEPGAIEVVQEEQENEPRDVWDWKSGGLSNFLKWLLGMMNNVPQHSGRDTTGLERAISYFESLDREISKALRMDFKQEIDAAKAESAREQIENGIERLIERLERVQGEKFKRKNKKKAYQDVQLVKNAKIAGISGIVVTVPLLISRIARTLINGKVSAGHDLEDMFKKQAEDYNLSKREKAELVQLMEDMGYPIFRDRGFILGEDKPRDGFDWAVNYPA